MVHTAEPGNISGIWIMSLNLKNPSGQSLPPALLVSWIYGGGGVGREAGNLSNMHWLMSSQKTVPARQISIRNKTVQGHVVFKTSDDEMRYSLIPKVYTFIKFTQGLFKTGTTLGDHLPPPNAWFSKRDIWGPVWQELNESLGCSGVKMRLDVRAPEAGSGVIRGQNLNLAEKLEAQGTTKRRSPKI